MSVDSATTPGVCEIWIHEGAGAAPEAPPDLLIETPHGATRREHYDALRARLRGPLPDDLEAFFFVNTDVGSFETARAVAGLIVEQHPSQRVVVLRCLIPRTFIDCNRLVGATSDVEGITPALPDYIRDEADRKLLGSLHRRYLEVAEKLYETVCGDGGLALILHTYAPRSVSVDRLDGAIVETLRSAYAPGRYESWPRRPDVDVISELSDGVSVAPRPQVEMLKERYARIGIEVKENATYRLYPATLGHVHSVRHPGQVLCVELNRELLADPYSPFEEMRVGGDKTQRMAAPLAAAVNP